MYLNLGLSRHCHLLCEQVRFLFAPKGMIDDGGNPFFSADQDIVFRGRMAPNMRG